MHKFDSPIIFLALPLPPTTKNFSSLEKNLNFDKLLLTKHRIRKVAVIL